MPAYNVQGAPALGRLPGLPAKRNVTTTVINQYYSAGIAEKVVAPIPAASPYSTGSGNYLWAAGRAANVEGLGLAYYSQSGTYRVQAFTYGNDTFQMVGSPVNAQHTASMFGGHTLRLSDGSFLAAHRGSLGGAICRVSVNPNTYAITQDTNFITFPTSGTCVSGEAFTCSPGSYDFGFTPNGAGAYEPAWFADGTEIHVFGSITIAGVAWVAVFVYSAIGQLVRVHKISTYTRNASSAGTYLHVRRVNAYYHICVLNRGSSSSYPMVARYVCCSADFTSDISVVYGDVSWSDPSSYYYRLIMAADSKALVFFVVNVSTSPYSVTATFARAYKLDAKGKAVTSSANNQLPAWSFGISGANSLLQDLFTYATYSSSSDAFVRAPEYVCARYMSAVPITGGYLAVSLKHGYAESPQDHIYKGGYKFNTLSDANDDLLMRFCPRVAVNQVDDSATYGSYYAPQELFELSGGYWLGLQNTSSSYYQLALYKEQA